MVDSKDNEDLVLLRKYFSQTVPNYSEFRQHCSRHYGWPKDKIDSLYHDLIRFNSVAVSVQPKIKLK